MQTKNIMERKRNIKQNIVFVILLLLFCSSYVSPTTINGRFTILNTTSSEFTILLQINTDSGSDELGGATFVFSFDTTAISFPNNPVKYEDYTFYNFNGGNYSTATISKPIGDQIWVNIDLPYNNSNNGTVVSKNPEWTDVVSLQFTKVNSNKLPNLSWLLTSLFWAIYDANNITPWENGEFEDLVTSIDPDGEFPTKYVLEQNYPNPFNPSTKIVVDLPNKTVIKLQIYNLLGEVVKEIANGEYDAGTYEFTFEASGLASGVYLYRLETPEFINTKKMILLR